ncbi:Uncharacterised protein [Yersinia kristensenii]|nr:Uncharacterised protein [Yersinia kristensenii]
MLIQPNKSFLYGSYAPKSNEPTRPLNANKSFLQNSPAVKHSIISNLRSVSQAPSIIPIKNQPLYNRFEQRRVNNLWNSFDNNPRLNATEADIKKSIVQILPSSSPFLRFR